ncbi:MAG: DUF2235 domain-containing protein [Ferruginibacter sp.]|nr:DUF2235 domain-containing protein [Ferruginibacter sp.]
MKRIVLCCDGTWNKPGSKDRGKVVKTNVQKIYEAIQCSTGEVKQVKFYGQGVGTGFTMGDHFLGGGTGLGIDRNIQDAYKFIMWNYEPSDELYLFGFSRGAYTVRSLAGLIRNCGIMKPEFLHLVSEAYHLYRDRTPITHPDSDLMKAFKKSYGIDDAETKIKMMGVWDTVGALGIPLRWFQWLNKKYTFHDVKLGSQIKYAYHALAADEKRKIFEPALWELSEKAINAADPQICEQVWFPGVHSNVGGGYADSGLSDIALLWMINKAANTGLEFDKNEIDKIKGNSYGELRKSTAGIYAIAPKMVREINNNFAIRTDPETGEKTQVKVLRNESIHYTCFERHHKYEEYKPANIFKALSLDTPFEPLKEKWEITWLDYIKGLAK